MKWAYLSKDELMANIAACVLDTIGKITESATDASVVPLIEGVRIAATGILDSIRDSDKEGQDDDAGGKD